MTDNVEAERALVAGKYRLTRMLGRGGMGSVWEGVHVSLGNRVAVKFIDAEYAESPEARGRFENEARAAAKLRSKYVVDVYDHGVGDDGRPFIVMEYLEGEPLDQRLDRVGRLVPRDAALILHQVCRALSKAHVAGVVHRDLKPENIFLVWDDEDGGDIAKVVDFGIAKFTDTSLTPSSATRTGSVLGTPYYMSPEQARGLRSVDFRADIWSLGVIAYRCIVGALPFEGEAVGDLLVKLCTEPIPVPSQAFSGVPPGFDAFVLRALERDPERRFQSVRDFSDSLSAVCGLTGRGAYSTGETQASVWGADGTGPYRAVDMAGGAVAPVATALNTGAPLTQTPALAASTPRKRSVQAIVAGLGLLLMLVLTGAFVMAKKFGTVTAPAAAVTPASSARLTSIHGGRPAAGVDLAEEPDSPRRLSKPAIAGEVPTLAAPAPTLAAPAPAVKAQVVSRPPARPARPSEAPRPKTQTKKPEIDLGY